ncbi:hypothetical protein D3C72_2141810 [compost metagenome]
MTVSLRARHLGGADLRAGARLVLDDEGLAGAFGQFLSDDAGGDVGDIARGIGDDDGDGIGRPVSGGGGLPDHQNRERSAERGMQAKH